MLGVGVWEIYVISGFGFVCILRCSCLFVTGAAPCTVGWLWLWLLLLLLLLCLVLCLVLWLSVL